MNFEAWADRILAAWRTVEQRVWMERLCSGHDNPWASNDLLLGIKLGDPRSGVVVARRCGLLGPKVPVGCYITCSCKLTWGCIVLFSETRLEYLTLFPYCTFLCYMCESRVGERKQDKQPWV